jgi:TRAP-type transport system periplasmic protein
MICPSIDSFIQVKQVRMNLKLVICLFITTPYATDSVEVIKIGTLVPAASPWGDVLSMWANNIDRRSLGKLKVFIYYNGVQGDESATVTKLKIGELDGALLTATGLSRIYMPILALQMPGLFKNWTKLDIAWETMNSNFTKGLNSSGFSLISRSHFGAMHLLSKGFRIKTPTDMRDKKVFVDRSNPIERFVYEVIKNVTTVSISIPEVLPKLNTGAINIVNAPPLFSEQFQWSSKLDTINKDVNALVTGGLIISTKRMASLPDMLRVMLLDISKMLNNQLTTSVQYTDDAALLRMQRNMQVVTLTAEELSQWDVVYNEVRRLLAQNLFSVDLVSKLEQLSN